MNIDPRAPGTSSPRDTLTRRHSWDQTSASEEPPGPLSPHNEPPRSPPLSLTLDLETDAIHSPAAPSIPFGPGRSELSTRVADDYFNLDPLQYRIPRSVLQQSQSYGSNFLLFPRSYIANGLQSVFFPREAASLVSAQTRLPEVPGYLLEDHIHEAAIQHHLEHGSEEFAGIQIRQPEHSSKNLTASFMERLFDTNPIYGPVHGCAYQTSRIQCRSGLLEHDRVRNPSAFKKELGRVDKDLFFQVGKHQDFSSTSDQMILGIQDDLVFSEGSLAKTREASHLWHGFLSTFCPHNHATPLLNDRGEPQRLPTVPELTESVEEFFRKELREPLDRPPGESEPTAAEQAIQRAAILHKLGFANNGSTVYTGKDIFAPDLAFFSTIALQVAWDFRQFTAIEAGSLWSFTINLPHLCSSDLFNAQRRSINRLQHSLNERGFLAHLQGIFNSSYSLEHQTEMRIRRMQIHELSNAWEQSSVAFRLK